MSMSTNYQLGKIYKIIDLNTNECYIGSTCEPSLARRLAKHVSTYKSYVKGKHNYVTSFKIIEQCDYDIVLIENYPCNSKDELHARESHYTQTIPCINKIKNQGLYNKLGQVNYKKQYREVNKNQIKEQNKIYHEANKDRILEKNKQHYQINKEKIKLQKNTKHTCECGGCYTSARKARHYKSIIHQNYEQYNTYYLIKDGLDIINKLDKYYNKIKTEKVRNAIEEAKHNEYMERYNDYKDDIIAMYGKWTDENEKNFREWYYDNFDNSD